MATPGAAGYPGCKQPGHAPRNCEAHTMAILKPLELDAEVVFLGANPSRDGGLDSTAIERAVLGMAGLEGETHSGLTRPSCSRMKAQYPKGVEIKNARQITILSSEELAEIGADMGLDEAVRPEWVGANMVLKGLPKLTEIPPGTRLVFDGGVGLVVDLENAPCHLAAEAIEAHRPGLGMQFPKHARGKRGVTAWVERPGEVTLGERCRPHIPQQRIWPPTALGL